MAHMRVRQKEIIVSQRSLAATLLRAPAHRNVFAKNISVTDNQLNALAAKRVILRIAANHAEGMKHIVPAKSRWSLNHCMWVQNTTFAQLHVFAHDGKRADLHALSQLRACRDRRLRMNFGLYHFADFSACAAGTRSIILHISVASAANWPFTV